MGWGSGFRGVPAAHMPQQDGMPPVPLLVGLAANRPNPSTYYYHWWYFATDTPALYVCTGSAWTQVAIAPGAAAGGDLAGTYPNPTVKSGVHLTGQVQIDSHFGALTSDTDGATVTFDMSVSDKHTVTLGGNRTLAVSNVQVGQVFTVVLVQDGTGSRTVTWFSGIKWPGGTTPTLTTTNGKADVFTFMCYSSNNYYGFVTGQNF